MSGDGTDLLRRYRMQLFVATWLSYFGFYVVRKVYAVVKLPLKEHFGFDDIQVAWPWTIYLVTYMLGQFLAAWLGRHGVKALEMGNTGGTINLGSFSTTFVNALHSSAQLTEDGVSHSLGNANGLVLHFEDEPTLYHMGDTDIFSDMALINELHQPEIGIVPIGDRFTMGGAVAALACQRFFKFSTAIPCHYGSFPIIDQTPETFVAGMESASTKVATPHVGGVVEI